jgi:hypothetical protein
MVGILIHADAIEILTYVDTVEILTHIDKAEILTMFKWHIFRPTLINRNFDLSDITCLT